MIEDEPDFRIYFKKIISSISVTLLWMLANSTLGIMFNFAFFETAPGTGNYIFYAWFILSLILLVIYLYRLWRHDMKTGRD